MWRQALESLCWTYYWPALYQRFPKPPFPQPSPEPVERDLAIHQNLLNLHRIFHRNPIEPDLDLHQNLPEGSGNFSGTLFNLTCLCTKASQTFTGFFSGTFSGSFSGIFSGTLLNLTWLNTKRSYNLFRNLFWNLFLEPCWTWLGFISSLPGIFSGSFFGFLLNLARLYTKASRILLRKFCEILLNLIRNILGTSLNLTRCPHQWTPDWRPD